MQRSFPPQAKGFTLVEILVSVSLLVFIVVILGTITSHVGKIWTEVNAQNQRRANARALLQFIAKDLQSIRLPVTPITSGTGGHGVITPSTTTGYLQLAVSGTAAGIPATCMKPHALFWQAPVGTSGKMAAVGYFVYWDTTKIPNKACLCRWNSSTASNSLISGTNQFNWAANAYPANSPMQSPYANLLAENVIALFVRCVNEAGVPVTTGASGSFEFDSLKGYTDPSTNITYPAPALPPAIEISIVVVDAKTALKIAAPPNAAAYLSTPSTLNRDIQSFVNGLPNYLKSGAEVYSTTVFLPHPAN